MNPFSKAYDSDSTDEELIKRTLGEIKTPLMNCLENIRLISTMWPGRWSRIPQTQRT